MERAERTTGQMDVGQKAKAALAASPIYVLRELNVQQCNGRLVLTGRVDSYYHKQLAQEVVRAVAGDLLVVNEVDVRYEHEERWLPPDRQSTFGGRGSFSAPWPNVDRVKSASPYPTTEQPQDDDTSRTVAIR